MEATLYKAFYIWLWSNIIQKFNSPVYACLNSMENFKLCSDHALVEFKFLAIKFLTPEA